GTAVERLLGDGEVARALFAGDDRGDLAAFDALTRLVEARALDSAVRVGVSSDEGPPEVAERADVVVDGSEGFREVLKLLAEPDAPRGRCSSSILCACPCHRL